MLYSDVALVFFYQKAMLAQIKIFKQYIVPEGIFVVKYSRFEDGVIIEDPIVISIQFIENDSISTIEDSFIREGVPFIWGFDKVGS